VADGSAVHGWLKKDATARAWYEKKSARDGGLRAKAIAGLMRKYAQARPSPVSSSPGRTIREQVFAFRRVTFSWSLRSAPRAQDGTRIPVGVR
jgi:hypothetical protein